MSSFAKLSIFLGCASFCAVGCSNNFFELEPPESDIEMTTSAVGATTGAVIGAGLGTVIGAASGNAGEGLAVGALAGAATGSLVGKGFEDRDKELAQQQEEIDENKEVIGQQKRELEELRRALDDRLSQNNAPSSFSGSDYSVYSYQGSPRAKSYGNSAVTGAVGGAAGGTPSYNSGRAAWGAGSKASTGGTVSRGSSYGKASSQTGAVSNSASSNYRARLRRDPRFGVKSYSGAAAEDTSAGVGMAGAGVVEDAEIDIPPVRVNSVTGSNKSRSYKRSAANNAKSVRTARAKYASKRSAQLSSPKMEVEEVKSSKVKTVAPPSKSAKKLVSSARGSRKVSRSNSRNISKAKTSTKSGISRSAKSIGTASKSKCGRAESEQAKAASAESVADKLFYLRRALRYCPSKASYHVEIAEAYRSIGRLDDAKYELNHALEIEPSNRAAKKALGSLELLKK